MASLDPGAVACSRCASSRQTRISVRGAAGVFAAGVFYAGQVIAWAGTAALSLEGCGNGQCGQDLITHRSFLLPWSCH